MTIGRETMQCVDLKVRQDDPEWLDRIVQSFGAAVAMNPDGGYRQEDGCCFVRCFGNGGFVKYAIDKQGYGKVEGEEVVSEI